MGLAGLGDLVLTCADDQSRNRRFRICLAAGNDPQAALERIGQSVEGYAAARAMRPVVAQAGVEMPLCDGVYRVLYEQLPAKDAVRRAHEPSGEGRSRVRRAGAAAHRGRHGR